jgi:hypothetical protein
MADFKDPKNVQKLLKSFKDIQRKDVLEGESKRIAKKSGFTTKVDGKTVKGPTPKDAIPKNRALTTTSKQTSKQLVKAPSKALTATRKVGKQLIKRPATALAKLAKQTAKITGKQFGKTALKAAVPIVAAVAEAADSEDLGPPQGTIPHKLESGEQLSQEEKTALIEGKEQLDPKPESFDEDRIANLMKQGFSRVEAESFIIKEQGRKDKIKRDEVAQAEQESAKSSEELNAQVENLEQTILLANEQGRDTTNLEAELQNLKSQQESIGIDDIQGDPLTKDPLAGDPLAKDPLAKDPLAKDPLTKDITKQNIEDESQKLQRQNLDIQAQQLDADKKIQEQRDIVTKSLQNLQAENKALEPIKPQNFWKNRTTTQKVLAFIGMALGGAPAVQSIQNAINADIDAQKLSHKETLARKQHGLKLVTQQLDRLQQFTNNDFKRQQIQLSKQKLGIEIAKINEERMLVQKEATRGQLLADKLSVKGGIDQKDFIKMRVNNPTLLLQDSAITLPHTGKLKLGTNKPAITELRKYQGDVAPAMEGVKRLLKMADNGSELSLEDQGVSSTEMVALIGQLRIPFTGPGVLQEKEFDRLLKNIGSPLKIFALSSVEKAKLNTVLNKLGGDLLLKYKQAGVDATTLEILGPREALIRTELKKNKTLKRSTIGRTIDSLIKMGKLKPIYGE